MAAPDRFVAWCKQEQASIEQELELMVSGKVRIVSLPVRLFRRVTAS
jgi:hypothetical protein